MCHSASREVVGADLTTIWDWVYVGRLAYSWISSGLNGFVSQDELFELGQLEKAAAADVDREELLSRDQPIQVIRRNAQDDGRLRVVDEKCWMRCHLLTGSQTEPEAYSSQGYKRIAGSIEN
jgi:hypothetical protein